MRSMMSGSIHDGALESYMRKLLIDADDADGS